MLFMISNKYINGLIPGILIHLGLGGVYSWSQITNKLALDLGVDESSTNWIFVYLTVVMGISALFSNYIVRKIGLKETLITGVSLFVIGMSISSLSIQFKSLSMLILGYGVISSIGIGLCYLSPIKNVIMWFPKSSGLPIGLIIFSFNVSGLISYLAVSELYNDYNSSVIISSLMLLGVIPMSIGVPMIKKPIISESFRTPKKEGDLFNIVFSRKFFIIWLILCMKLSAGLMIFYNVISISSYSFTAFSYDSITTIVITSAVLCGLGKLSIPWITDKIKGCKLKINYAIFGIPLIMMVITYLYHEWSIIPLLLFVSSFMYGAGLSSIPVILKECYGFRYLGTIQGIMFTSWCVAGLLGAKLGVVALNDYGLNILLLLSTVMYVIGFVLSVNLINIVKKETRYELS